MSLGRVEARWQKANVMNDDQRDTQGLVRRDRGGNRSNETLNQDQVYHDTVLGIFGLPKPLLTLGRYLWWAGIGIVFILKSYSALLTQAKDTYIEQSKLDRYRIDQLEKNLEEMSKTLEDLKYYKKAKGER